MSAVICTVLVRASKVTRRGFLGHKSLKNVPLRKIEPSDRANFCVIRPKGTKNEKKQISDRQKSLC